MLIAVIQFIDFPKTKKQITLIQHQIDGVELRLDYSSTLDFNAIEKLRQIFKLPIIFTLRKKSQGGHYRYSENQRLQDILDLCKLNPDYIDLEYDIPVSFFKKIKSSNPHIKLICSYHHFTETPMDIFAILKKMQHPCIHQYKIATQANSSLDALRMLEFVLTYHNKHVITGICMGRDGQSTRILSPIIGNAMNYISVSETKSTASGQLTLNDASAIYSLKKLNSKSKIYALLGNPIDLSMGHHLHNRAIKLLNENAVYIKLRTSQEELPSIIKQCRRLPFYGFSITMPLKESILPLLDDIEYSSQSMSVINSISRHQNKYIGFNTDGIGAIQALSEMVDVSKQKIIILGSGGAARAIAYEAHKKNAKIIILNRTIKKAKKLANELECEAYDFSIRCDLKNFNYTVLINTLPECAYSDLNIKKILRPKYLLNNTIIMDVIYLPTNTLFQEIAHKTNSIYIGGHKMYVNQAIIQIKNWYQPDEKQLCTIKRVMNQYFIKRLKSAVPIQA